MDIMLQRIIDLIGNHHGAVKSLADSIGVPANLISDWKGGRSKSYTREVGGSSPPVSTITKARKSLIIQWFSGLFYTFAHTAQRQNFALRCALFYYFDVKSDVKKSAPTFNP